MKVPRGGMFDESRMITGKSGGLMSFIFGSLKLKCSIFELCKKDVDYRAILDRNYEEGKLVKRVTSKIKNIEIRDEFINIEV